MERLLGVKDFDSLVAVNHVPINIAIEFVESHPECCSCEYRGTLLSTLYSYRTQGYFVKLVFRDGLLSYTFRYDWADVSAHTTFWFDELSKEQVEDFHISSLESLL